VKDLFDHRLSQAWITAAGELGIEVVSPFVLATPQGKNIEYTALVKNFGTVKGMLILSSYDMEKREIASGSGFGYSCLDSDYYRRYERRLFVETLNEWGWKGSKSGQPGWYEECTDDA
jgi:hypothetical protein